MNFNSAIVVTGAAGFIGSCLVSHLNNLGFTNLVLVDEFQHEAKELNLQLKMYTKRVERALFFEWLAKSQLKIDFVFHLGARTDTTEFNYSIHQELNVTYSQNVWRYCVRHSIPLVYASSAATYGDGKTGYDDDHRKIKDLLPLNPYGVSKNEFDKWVLQQEATPPFWAGLKFFNVYGPNEYHKHRMASVIFHSFNQIRNTGRVKLFKSHKRAFKHGGQLRDFIYVKDVLNVCAWLTEEHKNVSSGIYNLGTGIARTFLDLAMATFRAAGIEPDIEFIDMPDDLRNTYQYHTQAEMQKLSAAGYKTPFYSLEDGISDYVKNFLVERRYF